MPSHDPPMWWERCLTHPIVLIAVWSVLVAVQVLADPWLPGFRTSPSLGELPRWTAVSLATTIGLGGVGAILGLLNSWENRSSMTNWIPGAIRWAQFGKFDLRSVVDATVTTLGQNDLTVAGMDVETLKVRHATMLEGLRAVVGGPIYLGSITLSNKAAAVEAVRRDFNTWRSTLPAGERGVFSFAAAVGDTANEDLLPEYSADGLHPNAAGQQKMADEVLKAPVTPYVLPPAKLKSLSA